MALLRATVVATGLIWGGVSVGQAQLASEPIPSVETLPERYPANWLFAHDLSFYSLASGRVFIVDPTSQEKDVHGIIDAGQMAGFAHSESRGELYVAETFYSRGMRGARSDFLTIYDAVTLNMSAQIELPGGKRSMSVTHKNALQKSRDGGLLFVFNFTPASSVTILDLESRAVVNEIQMPGCMMVYPHGERGFASLCGDGSLIAFDLDEGGQAINEYRSDAFNDIDGDPLFMKAVYVGDTAYFPSFKGDIQAVRLAGGEPEILDRIYLTGEVRLSDHGAHARPSGWQVISKDARGRIYVLMRPNAGDGDHKSGGSFVWIYDPKSQRVVNEIALKGNSISIEATGGGRPLLALTSEEMHLDIYDARSGDYLRKIGGWGASTPYTLHAVKQ